MAQMLFLVRHGEALPRGSLAVDDHRWLTQRGRERFGVVARRFARRSKVGAPRIVTSPLPRALMTAEILWQRLARTRAVEPVTVVAELAPEVPEGEALAALRAQLGPGGLVAVGHEPQLSALLRLLLGDGAPAGEMKKGAIAAVSLSKRRAPKLRFVLLPEKKVKSERGDQ